VKLIVLAGISMLVLLAACQSNDPPPLIKPYKCPAHALETGKCGM
jgi:hypothetical protein